MYRLVIGGLLAILANIAVNAPAASALSNSKNNIGFMPQQVEYARAKGDKGGMYCFAPVDANGRIDYTQTRAFGSNAKPVKVERVTLTVFDNGQTGRGMMRETGLFAGQSMTADEFCAASKTRFDAMADDSKAVASLF